MNEPRTDVIAVWPATGTAAVAAVHDKGQRAIDVHCSGTDPGCGRFCTYLYDRGTTRDELLQLRHTAANAAFVHATNCRAGNPGTDASDRD
jgi:hypothetical protein